MKAFNCKKKPKHTTKMKYKSILRRRVVGIARKTKSNSITIEYKIWGKTTIKSSKYRISKLVKCEKRWTY